MNETISVRRSDGTIVAVYGEISGPFGIHASLNGQTDKFTVTHLQTQNAVKTQLSQGQAKDLVRRLLLTNCNWDFKDRDEAALLGDVVVPIIRAVLAEVK